MTRYNQEDTYESDYKTCLYGYKLNRVCEYMDHLFNFQIDELHGEFILYINNEGDVDNGRIDAIYISQNPYTDQHKGMILHG